MNEDEPIRNQQKRSTEGKLLAFLVILLIIPGWNGNGQEEKLSLSTILQNANACYQKNLFKEALHWCEQAETTHEDRSSVIFLEIELLQTSSLIELKQFRKADSLITYLFRVLKQPGDGNPELLSNLHYLKGMILIRTSDPNTSRMISEEQACIDIREKNNLLDTILVKAYNNISFGISLLGDNKRALWYARKAIQLTIELEGPESPRLGRYYTNLAINYSDLGMATDAMKMYDLAENSLLKIYGRQYPYLAKIYTNKAIIFKDKGDFDRALDYYRNAEEIYLANPDLPYNSLVNTYLLMASLYLGKNDYSKTMYYVRKSLPFTTDPANLGQLYLLMGISYRNSGLGREAIPFLEKAISCHKKMGEHYFRLGFDYYSLGICYDTLHQVDKAFTCLERSKDITMKAFGLHHPRTAETLSYLGNLYEKTGDYQKALEYTHQAMMAMTRNFNNGDIFSNPPVDSIQPELNMIDVIKRKSAACLIYYKAVKDIRYLKSGLETLDLASRLIDKFRQGYESEQSRLYLSANQTSTFNQLVDLAYELYQLTNDNLYIQKAFEYAERNKSSSLLASLTSAEARQFSGIPEQNLKVESELVKTISGYKEALYEARKTEADSDRISSLQKSIANLQITYDSLLQTYETKYPEYYRLKYRNAIVNLDGVQRSLQRQQAVLEYILTDTSLYIFLVTREGTSLLRQNAATLQSDIQSFLKYLTHPDFAHMDLTNFRLFEHAGYRLYSLLLEPYQSKIRGKELIIIPDGIMAYIPMDVLLTRDTDLQNLDFARLPYLLKENLVSYTYSASLMLNRNGHIKLYPRLIAFAPDYSHKLAAATTRGRTYVYRKNLAPLPGALEEVKTAGRYFHSTIMTGANATETAFKKDAPRYDILHLAMHTVINNEDPMYSKLAFAEDTDDLNDGLLNTYEIYNLKFRARLAVLSSCNSGNGVYSKGEGVISLGRAFMYAGCPSILMSLWEIEDKSSVELIKNFYLELSRGKRIDESLRTAKLRFLSDADPLTAHPYFWSGYAAIGSIEPVARNQWLVKIMLMVLILASVTGTFVLLRTFTQHRKDRT